MDGPSRRSAKALAKARGEQEQNQRGEVSRKAPSKYTASVAHQIQAPSRHVPKTGKRVTGQATEPEGNPQLLLRRDSPNILVVGVDFGTKNTSAAWAVLARNGTNNNIEDVRKINALRSEGQDVRFSTIAAILPCRYKVHECELVFAEDASAAFKKGKIGVANMFEYIKLGFFKSLDNVIEEDRKAIEAMNEKNLRALTEASKFKVIKVSYPDMERPVKIQLRTIEDVIQQYLRYFFGKMKMHLMGELGLSLAQINTVIELNTAVAFAAPNSWDQPILNSFSRLIKAAQWPSAVKIWSEPKAAAVSHIVRTITSADAEGHVEFAGNYLKSAFIVADIGGGTMDLATIRPTNVDLETFSFQTVVQGEGSTTGGYLLDAILKARMVEKLGDNLTSIMKHAAESQQQNQDEFLTCFQYDEARKDFDATGRKYKITYIGEDLPIERYGAYIVDDGIVLSRDDMTTAHDKYSKKVVAQINDQILATDRKMGTANFKLHVLLAGGMNNPRYLRNKIEQALRARSGVTIEVIETVAIPHVAVGCILCLRQLDFGSLGSSRNAFGVPTEVNYDPSRHAAGDIEQERLGNPDGVPTVDEIKWIVKVGDEIIPGRTYTTHQQPITNSFWEDDEWILVKTDPRDNPGQTITIEQDILRTSDAILCRTTNSTVRNDRNTLAYKLEMKITPEQWVKIETARRAGYHVGFWQEGETWVFKTMARLEISWSGVQLRCQLQVPSTGSFDNTDPADFEIWKSQEIFLNPLMYSREGNEAGAVPSY